MKLVKPKATPKAAAPGEVMQALNYIAARLERIDAALVAIVGQVNRALIRQDAATPQPQRYYGAPGLAQPGSPPSTQDGSHGEGKAARPRRRAK